MRVTTKGQVTIPLEVRQALGIVPGTELSFRVRGSRIEIEKAVDGGAGRRGRSAPASGSRMERHEHRRPARPDQTPGEVTPQPDPGALVDTNALIDVITRATVRAGPGTVVPEAAALTRPGLAKGLPVGNFLPPRGRPTAPVSHERTRCQPDTSLREKRSTPMIAAAAA